MKWPRKWNLLQDSHGQIHFPNPNPEGAIAHRDSNPSSRYRSDVTISALYFDYPLEYTLQINTPTECSLDVRNDTRCDDAKSLLFGESTSVGQICSIAEAVTTNPDTALPELLPDNMPGTCCLDKTTTFENFGERVRNSYR